MTGVGHTLPPIGRVSSATLTTGGATMAKATVTFFPEGKHIQVEPGTRLTVAAKEAGAFIDAPCGDRGVLRQVPRAGRQGALGELTAAERKALNADDLADGWRLACQAEVLADIAVRVPFGTLQTVLTGIQQTPANCGRPCARCYVRLSRALGRRPARRRGAPARRPGATGVRVGSLEAARDLARVLRRRRLGRDRRARRRRVHRRRARATRATRSTAWPSTSAPPRSSARCWT